MYLRYQASVRPDRITLNECDDLQRLLPKVIEANVLASWNTRRQLKNIHYYLNLENGEKQTSVLHEHEAVYMISIYVLLPSSGLTNGSLKAQKSLSSRHIQKPIEQ